MGTNLLAEFRGLANDHGVNFEIRQFLHTFTLYLVNFLAYNVPDFPNRKFVRKVREDMPGI